MSVWCCIGLHNWSENKGGERTCKTCGVTKPYGLTGLLKPFQEMSDEELERIAKRRWI